MRIREAKPSDIAAVDQIINEHWPVNIEHSKELQNPNSIFLVSEDDVGQIIGIAYLD